MNKYEKFKKMETRSYSEVTQYLKKNTHLTAREWMIARLCADFKTISNHSEMTWIGQNLPELVPFVEEPYTRQEVSNALATFKKKVRRSGNTFFYAYYAGLIDKNEMIQIIHKMVLDIKELMEVEGGDVSSEHATEVQMMVADVLRRINELMEMDE